ncbi:lipase member H [Pundamilia nyererei]|uniref:Lipase H n=1 Tax=Pundamilia nyererei TaxID=303518 RepID=A0A3B4G814_9CICH|nr:PREDICTED: lipase member H [Pundamilia nyererei]
MLLWQYLITFLLVTVQICKAEKCDEFTDLNLGHSIIGTSLKVRLLLYTRLSGTCGTLMSHTDLSAYPQFNALKPTTFIIHGYRPTGSPPKWLDKLTERLLVRKDINVIVVDWNYGAATLKYWEAVKNTRKVASNITALINMLQEHGADLSSIHMIGVSLGAHISGFTGANLKGEIGRITALDPAGPGFKGKNPEDRLDSSDAQFVDALHTDMDLLGFREPLGHIDFYANGGADQPGCPKTIFSGQYLKCDHRRSVFLFIDSINATCTSRTYPCSSYKDFLDGKCLTCSQFGNAGCPILGYDVIKWKDILLEQNQTKAYFKTNEKSPYCMTNYRIDVVIWNKDVQWGYLTVKLHGNGKQAQATIDHKSLNFKKFTDTELLATFDKDIQWVEKVSVKFSTGNVLQPKRKLRILRIRLKNLEPKGNKAQGPLCRYDVLLEENKEVTFRPIPCEESNF